MFLLGYLTFKSGASMIELACYDCGLRFVKLEYPAELEKLKIGKFEYFNKHLGMNDYKGNFSSWLRRPSVNLIAAIDNITIVGWVMTEKWKQNGKDSRSVYVLRAIEVSPAIARKGIGRVLFFLSFKICSGHMLTKPVNSIAKSFFQSMGFKEPDRNCPIDLSNYPGYLFLPEGYNLKNIPHGLKINTKKNSGYMMDISRKEIFDRYDPVSVGDPDVVMSVSDSASIKETVEENALTDIIKNELQVELENYSVNSPLQITNSVSPNNADTTPAQGIEFLKEHKMMSQCSCGEYMTHKYAVSGNSPGFLFVCVSCRKERYFLKKQ